jgi:hypothetical protein
MTRQNASFRTIGLLFPLLLIAGTAQAQSGPVAAQDFGMQCGQATGECPAPITLPTVPGLLRLWDSHVFWSSINDQQGGPYNWKVLDAYLDAIAADPSHPQVLYTFGWVPCWNVLDPQTECIGPWQGSSPYPPKDLGQGSNGSATFNAFVQALVTHCFGHSLHHGAKPRMRERQNQVLRAVERGQH